MSVQPFAGAVTTLEEDTENALRRRITQFRAKNKGPLGQFQYIHWDRHLEHLLMPALEAYEMERVYGFAPGNEQFQQSIRRTIPMQHTFRVSVPRCTDI